MPVKTKSGDKVHEYSARGACLEVFNRRDPEILVSGPAGTGKSRACLEKMHYMSVLNPGMRSLIVRKTATSLTSTGLETYRKWVAAEAIALGSVVWHGGSGEHPGQYRYANGSTITVGGMDRATRIMSSEYDLIYVQEATELTENDWEALTTRLRSNVVSFQQLLADCNPQMPTHWLKKRADTGSTTLLESWHEDNPILFADHPTEPGKYVVTPAGEAYLTRLDALTGPRYQRLRWGRWVGAEGLIYDEWDTSVHLVDAFEIPSDWRRWWGVDFGFTNPMVVQCWAEDGDGRLFLYREFYATRTLVDDAAQRMLDIVAPAGAWLEPKPTAIICDHDAEGRETFSRRIGQSTVAANKQVSKGIQAVQTRVKDKRIFIFRDAVISIDPDLKERAKPTSTADEILGYIWDIKDGKQPKEEPVKEDDHGCDAMRYVVAQRDLGGRPNIRWLG
jgi:phage terminase large subunit